MLKRKEWKRSVLRLEDAGLTFCILPHTILGCTDTTGVGKVLLVRLVKTGQGVVLGQYSQKGIGAIRHLDIPYEEHLVFDTSYALMLRLLNSTDGMNTALG